MTQIDLTLSDAVKWANEYDGELFHALFCDSPYHLTSIVKRFGKDDSAPAKFGKDGVFARQSRGFMGQEWDGGDVAFRPETWHAFGKVMHDGAFGMTYGGSRGWHRLAVAIEDAGFIIHPTIFGWAYGQGFPKATNPSELLKPRRGVVKTQKGKSISNDAMLNLDYETRLKWYKHEKALEGYKYGLQALKPAVEPIIVFQKPYKGRPIDNITGTGAGVLNIDGARIGTDEIKIIRWVDKAHPFGGSAGDKHESVNSKGRYPSNFILLDDEAAQALDRQSGNRKSGNITTELKQKRKDNQIFGEGFGNLDQGNVYGDEGGASRFFYVVQEQIDSSDPIFYESKVGNEERNAGLESFDLLSVNDGQSSPIDNPYQRGESKKNNPHPTLKPISLNRYLATLLLPPIQYAPRRLFVPFSGVGSEVIGAMQAGFEYIHGVEMTPAYIPIAKARVEYWKKRG